MKIFLKRAMTIFLIAVSASLALDAFASSIYHCPLPSEVPKIIHNGETIKTEAGLWQVGEQDPSVAPGPLGKLSNVSIFSGYIICWYGPGYNDRQYMMLATNAAPAYRENWHVFGFMPGEYCNIANADYCAFKKG